MQEFGKKRTAPPPKQTFEQSAAFDPSGSILPFASMITKVGNGPFATVMVE